MKVDLKLSADQILYLVNLITIKLKISVIHFAKLDVPEKLEYSIMIEVSDLVVAKGKAVERSNSLFDQKKKHKFSLKYYHAFMLMKFVRENAEVDDYKKMLNRTITDKLHKKIHC